MDNKTVEAVKPTVGCERRLGGRLLTWARGEWEYRTRIVEAPCLGLWLLWDDEAWRRLVPLAWCGSPAEARWQRWLMEVIRGN